MIVTFVSQCEQKALAKSRRVLDAFANRIGDRVWQTAITNDGLGAVKKLLRKTASKNTAVSCHLICGHRQSKLLWIVGNRRKFNEQGIVPVNSTEANVINNQWENDWHCLPLIKCLSALAGLFHDWGKASLFFQNKLKPVSNENKFKGDPIRHEWMSVLLLKAIVNGDKDDQSWLQRLSNNTVDEKKLQEKIREISNDSDDKNTIVDLPDAAKLIAWLIMSHHRLPFIGDKDQRRKWREEKSETPQKVLKNITQQWGYTNNSYDFSEKKSQEKLKQCFYFSRGLPLQSCQWKENTVKWAGKMQAALGLLDQAMRDGSWRLILYYARLSLMLGDHHYSSQDKDQNWQSNYDLIANTYQCYDKYNKQNGKGTPKQKLDEHLVGVAKTALQVAALLPMFETEPPYVYDIKELKKSSGDAFKWQDQAVNEIKVWQQNLGDKTKQYGFFAVNMASTGCGKTFANAKIMRALSPDNESLRYILALGLRTLTLQTGDEYRQRIGLDNSELAVLIGSQAVMDLHGQNADYAAQEKALQESDGFVEGVSESEEDLLDDSEVDYECSIPEDKLTTILTKERHRKLLYAPVLACTIDHLMEATETKRGGRFILPSLRLMSSDLVIDEVDDFSGKDLIAIGRLIHLAGMLGRKVMISSATIPPDLAEGYFSIYREGWQLFAKTREVNSSIGSAWIDEFGAQVKTIAESDTKQAIANYKQNHDDFIKKRASKLKKEGVKRKAEIINCEQIKTKSKEKCRETESTIEELYFKRIQEEIINKHRQHCVTDKITQKQVSFGVVRIAHIESCIAAAKYLIEASWSEDVDVKIMAYHSRQVLLMRSEQEKHLDAVLKRDSGDQQAIFNHPRIREHLCNSQANNVIFILVATPVEEIGRDHDFDWAVVEPSSFRSIIQLAGRVLRHRYKEITEPNIALMQYNLKALKKGDNDMAFVRPGYESGNGTYGCKLKTHDLIRLVDAEALLERVDALPRILRNNQLKEEESLIDLEHFVIGKLLTSYDNEKTHGPESMQGWVTGHWWLTALPQYLCPFRENEPQRKLYLVPKYEDWDDEFVFMEKDEKGRLRGSCEDKYGIKSECDKYLSSNRLWLERDYRKLLEDCAKSQDLSPCEATKAVYNAAKKYGEITIPYRDSDCSKKYIYSPQFGLGERSR